MKLLFTILLSAALGSMFAQTTITLHPTEDVMLDSWWLNGNDTCGEINASAWTHNGQPEMQRSFLKFNLTSIPLMANIQSATLTLYNNPNSINGLQNGEHSHLSGSNASHVQRITSAWQASTATWNV